MTFRILPIKIIHKTGLVTPFFMWFRKRLYHLKSIIDTDSFWRQALTMFEGCIIVCETGVIILKRILLISLILFTMLLSSCNASATTQNSNNTQLSTKSLTATTLTNDLSLQSINDVKTAPHLQALGSQ